MKYCTKCGKEIHDEAIICPHCGCAVAPFPNQNQNVFDAPSMGFAVLGFFLPLVGLIIYLCMKGTSPLKAASAGKGALIGFIVGIVVSIIYSIVIVSLIGDIIDSYNGYYYY